MPRYARVSNPDYENAAAAGASELNRIREESIRGENEKRIAAYERMHLELERAKQERQMAHDQAKTEQRIKYEYMAADAAKKLYAIDPSDPKATEKMGAVVNEFPQLIHNEPGLPSLKSDVQHYQSLIESGRRQTTGIDAKSEAADLRNQHSIELKNLGDQHAKELAQVREDLRKSRGPSDAERKAYGVASAKQDGLQKQLDGNQKFIDEQTAMKAAMEKNGHDTPDQDAMLAKLQKSRDTLQKEFDQHRITKNVLEGIRPELALPPAASATPAPATEGDRPPAEPDATDESPTASVAPVNPNLTVAPPAANPAAPVVPAVAAPAAATGLVIPIEDLHLPPVPAAPAPAPVVPTVAAPDPHKMALDWAAANPSDPRAAKIKALHGVQ